MLTAKLVVNVGSECGKLRFRGFRFQTFPVGKFPRTNYGKFNIRYFVPKIWNDIEESIQVIEFIYIQIHINLLIRPQEAFRN